MSYTLIEQETNINFNAESDQCVVYTAYPPMIRKIEKLMGEYPDEVKLVRKTDDDIQVELPKKWVKITPPRKVSEEQKERLREWAKTVGFKKKVETTE